MSGAIQKRIAQIMQNAQPDELAKVAYAEWTAKTPVGNPNTWKSGKAPAGYTPGNAKKSTILKNDIIHANYAYATRLDNGWSRQFGGQGMSKPALAAVSAYVQNKLKKKGV
jgi:hypothetical protein